MLGQEHLLVPRRRLISRCFSWWGARGSNPNQRIKSLSVASSQEFMGIRAAAQPRGAYSAEPGRTAVNCNPNCNPDACGWACSPPRLRTAGGPLPSWSAAVQLRSSTLLLGAGRPSFFRPDILRVAAQRPSVRGCYRLLALAVGCPCCCHYCCQGARGLNRRPSVPRLIRAEGASQHNFLSNGHAHGSC
jgi:hypothetical protein